MIEFTFFISLIGSCAIILSVLRRQAKNPDRKHGFRHVAIAVIGFGAAMDGIRYLLEWLQRV